LNTILAYILFHLKLISLGNRIKYFHQHLLQITPRYRISKFRDPCNMILQIVDSMSFLFNRAYAILISCLIALCILFFTHPTKLVG
jgi:hypothetical protein